MNRKQFLILVLALVVLGGAGMALFWQDIGAYRESGAKIGARLMPQFKLAEVAQMRLQDAKQQTTLVRKETGWVVQERGGYPASFQQISDLMLKLAELKVTQSEPIPATLLARVELNEPRKAGEPAQPQKAGDAAAPPKLGDTAQPQKTADAAAPNPGEGTGTLIEFKDAAGKTLERLILGKRILKKDPLNPLPNAVDGVPAGRYVLRPDSKDTVAVVVSDPLNNAEASPGRWLQKDFFKAERIKTLTVTPPGSGAGWKITRNEEWGQWKFAAGAGDLAASRAVAAVNALNSMSFIDVALDIKPQELEQPYTIVAETFDNLVYTIKIAKGKSGDDYLVNTSVSGEPPKNRTVEKDEKAEQKERRDKDFVDSRMRLELRLAREKAQSAWTYVVAKKDVEPLLRDRADLIARKDQKGEKGPPGMPRFPF
jgi:hypothetical protein